MNKQSNTYTIIYIIALVVIVGTVLAYTATALKPEQQANADADKMRQILLSVHVTPEGKKAIADDFNRYITGIVVNSAGEEIPGENAFDVNVAAQSKIQDADKRLLPIYVCNLPEDGTKYIIPVYGAGLWGPIWGYLALDDDGSTVYGAYFSHQGETPGLGAEIEKSEFQKQFIGKVMFKADRFLPVSVIKKGQKSADGEDTVDGISGGTITSKGVGAMLDNCLSPYKTYLENIRNK